MPLLWTKSHLVFRLPFAMCTRNPITINYMRPYLVLRRSQQYFPNNPNEISHFHPQLVLHQIPRKFR